MRDESEATPMTEFERALARAMQKVEVRAETTAKFLALAEKEAERKRVHAGGSFRLLKFSRGGHVFAMPRQRAWVGGAIAAMLVLGAVGGEQLHQRHERQQATLATQQFEAGVRVMDEALEQTRAQLERAGVRFGD